MAQITIINRIQNDFGMIPRALWQLDMSGNAKLCAAYLFCLKDGAAPYVAEIEAATGLGRDARRKAFAELEALHVIGWQVERNAAGRIVAKSLVVDYAPIIGFNRGPENQAHGNRAPEKPSDGSAVPVGVASRPCVDGISGDKERKRKETTRAARAALSPRRAAPDRPTVARPMGGGSGRSADVSENDPSARPADPWQRAASAAALGLKWLHPESGRWCPASAFAGEWDRASDGSASCSIAAE